MSGIHHLPSFASTSFLEPLSHDSTLFIYMLQDNSESKAEDRAVDSAFCEGSTQLASASSLVRAIIHHDQFRTSDVHMSSSLTCDCLTQTNLEWSEGLDLPHSGQT